MKAPVKGHSMLHGHLGPENDIFSRKKTASRLAKDTRKRFETMWEKKKAKAAK